MISKWYQIPGKRTAFNHTVPMLTLNLVAVDVVHVQTQRLVLVQHDVPHVQAHVWVVAENRAQLLLAVQFCDLSDHVHASYPHDAPRVRREHLVRVNLFWIVEVVCRVPSTRLYRKVRHVEEIRVFARVFGFFIKDAIQVPILEFSFESIAR